MIGLHAMEGAADGVLAHTWSSARRRRYWFNGREGGEVAAYAIVAGHNHQVPVIMATGCSGLCRETQELLGPHVVTVSVKQKLSDGSTKLFPAAETQRAISAGAQQAISDLNLFSPLKFTITSGELIFRRRSIPRTCGSSTSSKTTTRIRRPSPRHSRTCSVSTAWRETSRNCAKTR